MKADQRVYCKIRLAGPTAPFEFAIPAVVVRVVGCVIVCRDEAGKTFRAARSDVFPSKEACEASVPGLRVSVDFTNGKMDLFDI